MSEFITPEQVAKEFKELADREAEKLPTIQAKIKFYESQILLIQTNPELIDNETLQ